LLSPTQIHALVFGDTLTVVGTRLDAVTTAEIVQVSNGAVTAATILSASATSLVVRPNVALGDTTDIASQFTVRVIAPAGTATSSAFDARRPRVSAGLDEQTGVVFLGDFFNPARIVDAVLDAGGGNVVQLTVRGATENFVDASFDSAVVEGLSYQLSITYRDANNNNVNVAVPGTGGFAFRRNAAPGADVFGVSNFKVSGCIARDHIAQTGDDRGPIQLTDQFVFYHGDPGPSSMARFNIGDLLGGTNVANIDHTGMLSDFKANTIITLFNTGLNRGPTDGEANFVVDALRTLDNNANPTGATVALSTPVTVTFRAGLFSGFGKVGIVRESDRAWFVIDTTSGLVTQVATTGTFPPAQVCENAGVLFRGILEERTPGNFSFVWINQGGSNQMVRFAPATKRVSVAAQFSSLSDMCSFAVAIQLDRWYWHHEGGSQFSAFNENIGFCDAEICGDGNCQPGLESNVNCGSDCAPSCGNGVCEPGSENSGNCGADCAASCGDGVCNEAAAGCPTDCLGVVSGIAATCGDGYCVENERPGCPVDCP
jgi:hypothetical protein